MSTQIQSSPATVNHLTAAHMQALKNTMKITANNIANSNTMGFQAEVMQTQSFETNVGSDHSTTFSIESPSLRDTTQGPLVATQNPLDVALAGSGYLMVAGSNGTAYTRNGQASANENGILVNLDGLPILDEGGAEIPVKYGMQITSDGTITDSEGEVITRLGVVEFAPGTVLEHIGGNLSTTTAEALPATSTQVYQGYVEGSNVSVALEMVRMQEALAAYQQEGQIAKMSFDTQKDNISQLLTV